MSIQVHCDSCDTSLFDASVTGGGKGESLVIFRETAEFYGGLYPESRRDFCGPQCASNYFKREVPK